MILRFFVMFNFLQFALDSRLFQASSKIFSRQNVSHGKEQAENWEFSLSDIGNTISKKLGFNFPCKTPPFSCPNKDVTFWLMTGVNKEVEFSLQKENGIDLTAINPGMPWKVLIHGYSKSKSTIFVRQMKEAYFENGSPNLLVVDYSPLARKYCYLSSVKNVPLISQCTADMLEALVEKKAFNLSDLHIIGFSLGAEIAGRIHEHLKTGKPGRVTALDPAKPLFDGFINHIVSRSSGDFVDVIHTDSYLNGKSEPLGHADFYPNGGFFQSGCVSENNILFARCNHYRAPTYYAESINTKTGFYGVRCPTYVKYLAGLCKNDENNTALMGEYTSKTARGIYFLQTNSQPPYALGRQMPVTDT